jgi:lipopolysaccharide export system protein LptC
VTEFGREQAIFAADFGRHKPCYEPRQRRFCNAGVIRLSSASAFDQIEDRGFAVQSGRDAEQAFRRATRHSRRVRFLRRAIPVVVVLILCVTALVRYLDPMRVLSRLPLSTQGMVISGTKITMAAPKLSGYTNDARRYEMTAQSAAQDVTKPNLIELNQLNAKIEAADKSTINVSAAEGLFDRASGILTLNRNVQLTASNGLEVRLDEATINTATSEVISEKPVEVQTQQGTIKANRLEIENGGEVIHFIGAVNVYLPASEVKPRQPQAGRP